ncbi:hypothetical protein BB559_006688 [Furculomyces boomerangus]|uniref:Uncharacterized protein n=2 Tax=Harpellales TaxID=61421 RepID=A0A2T9Y149_9FUNG|nr:hypothetical protein BB559_006688 [Furculomyces boomerangus]
MTGDQFKEIFYKDVESIKKPKNKNPYEKEGRISSIDYDIITKKLENESKIVKGINPNMPSVEIIKFVSSNSPLNAISDLEVQVLSVLSAADKTESQIRQIEKKTKLLEEQVSRAIAKKQKAIALSNLKMLKHLETNILPHRYKAIETLHGIISQLQKSSGEAEYLEAIRAGTGALKSIRQESNLNQENIETTFENLAEVLSDQEEIDVIINSGNKLVVDAKVDIDESELEKELEKLILDAEPKQVSKENKPEKQKLGSENQVPTILEESEGEKKLQPLLEKETKKKLSSEYEELDKEMGKMAISAE